MAFSGVSRFAFALSRRCISKAKNPGQTFLFRCNVAPTCSFTSVAPVSNDAKEGAEVTPQKWRIVSGVCVLRMPSLSQEKEPLVKEFEELQDEVWLEKSKLSDFELEALEHERAKRAREKKALEDERPEAEAEGNEADEFDDLQESRELEVQAFKPAVRETEADLAGDMRSLDRKLDRVLYLLVKKPRKEHAWQMPQGGIESDESLLECANRELLEECGGDLDVRFYSSAPHAVYAYTHPPFSDSTPHQHGSKVFFMKAYCYGNGKVKLNEKELVDYLWVTKEEMKDFVSQEYYDAVQKILIK